MNHPRDDGPPSPLSVPTPVVLRIMPKVGSSAPIGYVYDPTPRVMGGKVDYLLHLQPSSHTKAMKFFRISAFSAHQKIGKQQQGEGGDDSCSECDCDGSGDGGGRGDGDGRCVLVVRRWQRRRW